MLGVHATGIHSPCFPLGPILAAVHGVHDKLLEVLVGTHAPQQQRQQQGQQQPTHGAKEGLEEQRQDLLARGQAKLPLAWLRARRSWLASEGRKGRKSSNARAQVCSSR
jgi:hypothetical protein